MRFQPEYPDYTVSPFTGMAWRHWVDAGKLLLDGVFRHIPAIDAPLRLPRHEHAVTYPQPGQPQWKQRSEVFEGVARTLLIAAPLLAHFPDLTARGIPLADYYRRAINRLTDPDSPEFVGDIDAIVAESGDNPYQMTCECASLVIALRTAPDCLWTPLDQPARDRVAKVLGDWAHRRTHPHNWRLFNILILAFLSDHGYPVDDGIYRDHLRVVRSFDAGDGWYRDGTLFDYYSVWAFQFYAPLWAHTTGYRSMPEMAAAIERSAKTLLRTYDRIFDRQGHQIMWGRSNIYRFAASAPFGSAFLLRNPEIRPGLARRVMSGNLLQFLGHPDFWRDGLPSIGFYGPFTPLIQPYSCAASPFWFGNAYHAVALGPRHPLWTATEEGGSWDAAAYGDTLETELAGPGIVVTQYGRSGASEIRTGKVLLSRKRGLLPHYSRLSFHSAFPWQADTSGGQPAMQYRFSAGGESWRPNLVLYGGRRDGVLYRRLVYNFEGGFGDLPAIDLADFALPEGLVRCDRLRVTQPDSRLSLAHYALPLSGGECRVERRAVGPGPGAITVASGERQLALVAVHGWNSLEAVREAGLHPESPESVLLVAHSGRPARYGGDPLRIALLLHRVDSVPWSDQDLWPFSGFDIQETGSSGSAPTVRFALANGRVQSVEYVETEGNLRI
jgi:hypothetical protein